MPQVHQEIYRSEAITENGLGVVKKRPDWDLNPGLKIRNLKGYPLPHRGSAQNSFMTY
jgi:hypothetical protein